MISKRTINVEKTETQNNLLFLLVAQISHKVTGNGEIEVDGEGKPQVIANEEQQKEIQALFNYFAPKMIETLDKYFAVFVRRNELYYKEPPLAMVG